MIVLPLDPRIIKHLLLISGWFGIYCSFVFIGDGYMDAGQIIACLIISILLLVAGVIWVYKRGFDKDVTPFKYYCLCLGAVGLVVVVISILVDGTMADSAAAAILAIVYSLFFMVGGILWTKSDKKGHGFSYRLNNALR
ncbi:MAG: hypothetical protein FWG87_08250 [Defluviitaleaceae bacterium]|nr:hypothetical protein [Defluviitaleaceae bacterium]